MAWILGMDAVKEPRDAMFIKNSQGRGCRKGILQLKFAKRWAGLPQNLNKDRTIRSKKNVKPLFHSIFL
ncbi:hypothetical protein [Oligoflexus tunisiensis]|uniref:hypothetical protein n=1 Tax=Oligoflexus tunisiensis TaxID=708132 RepID=UPI00159F27F2|nr:hypothetical protein [Oligoflexus tunisiensis]